MKWKPIETAPKDGEGVLLYIPDYPGDVQAASWSEDCWCLWGLSSVRFRFDEELFPTHWMPLPEAP